MTCKHCGAPIHLEECGPGQVFIHDHNGMALCNSDRTCNTWAEPEED